MSCAWRKTLPCSLDSLTVMFHAVLARRLAPGLSKPAAHSMGCPCSSMGLCSSCHAAPLLLLHQHSCTGHLLQTRLLGSCIKLFLLFHGFLKQNPTFHSGVGVTWKFPWGQEEETEGGMMAGAAEGEAVFGCLCGECYDCEAAWEFQRSLEAVSH